MPETSELRILIVDDYPIIRYGLRTLLEAQPGWKVCSEAATGQAALQKIRKLKPNIVLLDLDLPDMGGHEAGMSHGRLSAKRPLRVRAAWCLNPMGFPI